MPGGGSIIPSLGYNTPLLIGQSYTTIESIVSNFESLSFTFKTDQTTTVNAYWKNNPADPDKVLAFTMVYDPVTDPLGFIISTDVRGVYFSYTLENTSGVDQTSLSCSCYGAHSPNTPTPITIPTLITDSTEDLQITSPNAETTLITVGNKHGGTDYSQCLFIDQTDPRVGDAALTDSVFIGNRAGAGDSGNDDRYSNSVCVGAKSAVKGDESVAIGARMGANNGSGNSVTIGCFATASDGGVNIGRQCGPSNGTAIRNVCIGSQSRANSNAVSIGYDAGKTGVALASTVCIGSGCTQPGAAGRLAFGNTMEGVQAGATAGADTLPANPAGFLRLEWNGTLYKMPVYND